MHRVAVGEEDSSGPEPPQTNQKALHRPGLILSRRWSRSGTSRPATRSQPHPAGRLSLGRRGLFPDPYLLALETVVKGGQILSQRSVHP